MASAVFCLASTEIRAERIVSELRDAGFVSDDVSVLFHDKVGTRDFAHEHHTKLPEGATVGASTGGVVGGVLGVLAGIGTLAIPGVGPFIAAGPILAGLSGMAVGAAVGGLAGALVGLGIPEFEAKIYEGKLHSGNVLISCHTRTADDVRRAKEIFTAQGATDITTGREKSAPKVTAPDRDPRPMM
jgi:uncharacterized membrane protein